MGHIRLGKMPKTKRWRTVVAMFTGEQEGGGTGGMLTLARDVGQISDKTLDAARTGLERAIDDRGLRFTFYLLTQVVLAARGNEWQEGLKPFGIALASEATLFDLTAEMQHSIDDYLAQHGRATDISEMAQAAAGEALTALAGPRAVTLFGCGRDELQFALRELSTKNGFADLGQRFFGRFMTRFLNFYLSRVTAAEVNGKRLQQVGDITRFNDALQLHCQQSALIVRDFCGEWYSKTEFREGISLDNTSRFMATAMKKLQAELQQQAER